MFRSTRLKLTAWYLLIIMFVSALFSAFIYSGIDAEFKRYEIIQDAIQTRIEEGLPVYLPSGTSLSILDPNLINNSRFRLKMALVSINLAIFTFSGVAGYFLAGRTLRPIQQMVDDQNRFIADASHEFRTPLTALKTSIEVHMLDQDKLSADTIELLDSNLKQVDILEQLSNNLLTLAKYNNSTVYDESVEKLDLKLIVKDSINRVQPLAKKKKITISSEYSGELNMNGIPRSLTELFSILIENAVKYSPEETEIVLKSEQIDRTIKCQIQDHGFGIPKEDLPHIFKRFYRSSKSRTKNETHGYGLGLAIAHRIVEMHKGSIEVKSTVGKGTTFTIYFNKGSN